VVKNQIGQVFVIGRYSQYRGGLGLSDAIIDGLYGLDCGIRGIVWKEVLRICFCACRAKGHGGGINSNQYRTRVNYNKPDVLNSTRVRGKIPTPYDVDLCEVDL
jgi:hypothetical protein